MCMKYNLRRVEIEGIGTFYITVKMSLALHDLCLSSMALMVPVTLTNVRPVRSSRIPAIKFMREVLGTSLKEAKAACDAASERGKTTLIGSYPLAEALKIRDEGQAVGCIIHVPTPLECLAEQGV